MDKIVGNFRNSDSFPLDSDTLASLQDNMDMLSMLGNMCGDKKILSGCSLNSDGNRRGEGYVFLRTRAYPNGEVLHWPGGSISNGMHVEAKTEDVYACGETWSGAYTRRSLVEGAGEEWYSWDDFSFPEISGMCKGLFKDADMLQSIYPTPKAGWWALVGETLPAEVYRVDEESMRWIGTGTMSGELNVDLTHYLNKNEAEQTYLSKEDAENNFSRKTEAGVINIATINPEGGYYTLIEKAIGYVPLSQRQPGCVVTYPTAEGVWAKKQFIGSSADEWFYTSSKWIDVDTVRRNVNVIVAAYDSSEDDKQYADIVASADDKGYNVIRTALGRLGSAGGKITLMNGTYRGAIIDGETENPLSADIIYLNKENVIIEGMGKSTIITTDSTVADANIQVSKAGCVLRDLSLSLPLRNNSNYDIRLENVYIAGERNDTFADKSKVMAVKVVKPSEGIAGINAAIKSLSATGGKIYLESGTYSGTSGVTLYVSNITIEGQGPTTIISREGSSNTVFVQAAYAETLKNVVLRDLTIAQGGTFVTKEFTEKPVKLINCWVNGQYYYQSHETTANIITVGKGMDFDTVYKAYTSIDSTKPLATETNRYEIHVYGHVKEEKGKRLYLNRQYVDIIGHNAIIEYEDDDPVGESAYPCADIVDNAVAYPEVAVSYGDYNHSTYKDLHFLRTGTVNAYNFACVRLYSDYVTLINCTFENRTKSPSEFIPSNTPSGSDDKNGARRHGIVILCNNFDDECKTRLINCVGIGSPYGFQNTRGFYIAGGSPKLYNCVGYGGGMGERSHGIICHRYSKAVLYNCIGYGSKYTLSESNGECCGIRFQSMSQSECYNCIGYAGISDKSSGISVWHASSPKLINCIGYGGKGKESVGLDLNEFVNPLVLGGYYGVANNSIAVTFEKNNGNSMSFTLVEDAPCVIKKCVTWLTTSNITEANVPVGTTFSVRKADGTFIIDKSAVNVGMSALTYPNAMEPVIEAGEELTMFWQDANGNEIEVADDTLRLQFVYQYAAEGGHGLRLLSASKGVMRDVTFESNINGDGVMIDTVNNSSEIDRCTIIGNNGVAINSKRATLDNVNIRNSSIKGEIVNVNSFKEVVTMGGNNCKI